MSAISGVRWLTPPEQKAWRSFIVGHELLLDRLDRALREAHGISLNEYEILARLSERPGRSMRMAQLADSVCHSRSRLTHTVKRMERDGLLERTASADDGRGVVAVMTEEGLAVLETSAPTHVESVRRHLIDLTDDAEFATLGRIFGRVSDELLPSRPQAIDIR